jgi:flavin-dependent dehydrogenase
MNEHADILVVGSGAAAAAAAKLGHVLGHDVTLVAHDPAQPFHADVLLPESALASLRALGLSEPLLEVARPIRSHDGRWDRAEDTDVPGRDSSAQITEGDLAERLNAALENEGVPTRRGRVALIEPGEVPRVVLDTGVELRARFVLCSVPGLLPESLRARALAPKDVATTMVVRHATSSGFPNHHHVIEAFPEGWAWALRLDDERLQLTAFRDLSKGAWPAEALFDTFHADRSGPAGERLEVLSSMDRTIGPSLPSWEWDSTLVPIGRAAFAASPLSSLGTSHAIQSAYLAVALLHTRLADRGIDAGALAQWYTRETMRRALRTHALTALAGRGPLGRFGTDYWRVRSEDTWCEDAPRDLAGAAMRSRAFLERTQAGQMDDTLLQRSPALLETTVLFQQGPIVHPRLAVMSPDGLPVERDEWAKLSRLAASFSRPSTLGHVVSSACSSLADDRAKREVRKKIGQRVGRLIEAGVLEFVP